MQKIHRPTMDNKYTIDAFIYKGDLEEGLSLETPVWLHTMKFTNFRGARIGLINGTNSMVYEDTSDVNTLPFIS
jgi:3-deoxy-D-manno-octulosonic-acid transferase